MELLSGFACLEGIQLLWHPSRLCYISPSRARQLLMRMQKMLIETETEGAMDQDCRRQLSNSVTRVTTPHWASAVYLRAQNWFTVWTILRGFSIRHQQYQGSRLSPATPCALCTVLHTLSAGHTPLSCHAHLPGYNLLVNRPTPVLCL